MFNWFCSLSPIAQAGLATLFTWGVTALGAALVYCFRQPRKSALDAMLGFAAGVMTAASFWSLLAPALQLAGELGYIPWLTAAAGLLLGGGALAACDAFFRRRQAGAGGLRRCRMLMLSMTLHNIPEGMAVGVAFGALAHGLEGSTLGAALMLALGIGLQNFPEGAAISLPLLREGFSRNRSFFWGQASGLVEPLAGLLGAALALHVRAVLPLMLSFAAGAMLYVVTCELIPESQNGGRPARTALWNLAGFALMMVLDVALG